MAKGKRKKKAEKAKLGVASVITPCVNTRTIHAALASSTSVMPCAHPRCSRLCCALAADVQMKTYTDKVEPPKSDPKALDELIELAQKNGNRQPQPQKCEIQGSGQNYS